MGRGGAAGGPGIAPGYGVDTSMRTSQLSIEQPLLEYFSFLIAKSPLTRNLISQGREAILSISVCIFSAKVQFEVEEDQRDHVNPAGPILYSKSASSVEPVPEGWPWITGPGNCLPRERKIKLAGTRHTVLHRLLNPPSRPIIGITYFFLFFVLN